MNISGLIRSFVGDTHAAEPKTLELKVGEVVKGVVLQLNAEQDALINIGGVHVRAKLETPLKQGQVTLLQVQPETTASGQIVLKPLDASGVQIAEDSLGEVLKNVGLPDSLPNRQMIQILHQSGISISKEHIQAFIQLQAQMPAALQQDEWMPSAAVAFQKGIPLTPNAVSSVHQAVSGPALHETLQRLDSQINKLLTDNLSLSETTRSALNHARLAVAMVRDASNQFLSQTNHVIENSEANSPQPEAGSRNAAAVGGPSANTGAGIGAAHTGAAQLSGAGGSGSAEPEAAGSAQPMAADRAADGGGGSARPSGSADLAGSAGAASSAGTGASGGAGRPVPAAAAPLPGQAMGEAAEALNAGPAVATDKVMTKAPSEVVLNQMPSAKPIMDDTTAGSREAVVQRESSNPSGTIEAAAAQVDDTSQGTDANDHWISRLMKALGVEHEHLISRLPDKAGQDASVNYRDGLFPSQDSPTGLNNEQQKSADTLKSSLLQLMQADDVPSAFKEAAQQAVQQITGQQLLLNSDRASMFSHITLFVPLMNANGEQTAAVHIQSRKGARGEIDARNCRLVFDLSMKALGDTMVDVQVVDRIVSLRVLNDQPFLQQLLDSHREEIASGLTGIGYQFISLKCGPYPGREEASQGKPPEAAGKQENTVVSHLQSAYGKKPYKGMDVRV